MTFKEVNELFDEVICFLRGCGACYNPPRESSQKNIFWAISVGNYIYISGRLFVCWKMIDEAEIDKITEVDCLRLKPGNVLCVLECGSKTEGGSALIKGILKINYSERVSKVVWNRHGKGLKQFSPRRYCNVEHN